jgi:hypothetical protein
MMLLDFPSLRMHCPSPSFGYPDFLDGITMLPLSLIMLEFEVTTGLGSGSNVCENN